MQGYELNLKSPKTFNEKIVWKKIYDRNPLLPVIADKYTVRKYVTETLGKDEAENILIPLLYVTDKPETIPFDKLPVEYIIKANHSSGRNLIIEQNSEIDQAEIIYKCKEWLKEDFHFFWHEWAYQMIDRQIVVEKLMRDSNGNLPNDIKFHMIHGKCAFIQVDSERFTGHKRNLYDSDWKALDVIYGFETGKLIPKPEKFDDMLVVASELSNGFDYIRVDLYEIDDQIFFGEMTNYPESGYKKFLPEKYDQIFGELWRIKPDYYN